MDEGPRLRLVGTEEPDAGTDAAAEPAAPEKGLSADRGAGWQQRWWRALVRAGGLGALRDGEHRALSVLLAYADCAGRAWPGIARIAEEGGLSRRGAQTALAGLRRRSVIALVAHAAGGRGRATVYRLCVDPESALAVRPKGRTETREKGRTQAHKRAHAEAQKGAHACAPTGPGTGARTRRCAGAGEATRSGAEAEPAADAADASDFGRTLFARQALRDLLVDRGFGAADAERQITHFGFERSRAAAAHAEQLRATCKLRSWPGAFVHAAQRDGFVADVPVGEPLIDGGGPPAEPEPADEPEPPPTPRSPETALGELAVASRSAAELERLRQRVLDRLPVAARGLHARQGIDHPVMRALIAQELLSGEAAAAETPMRKGTA